MPEIDMGNGNQFDAPNGGVTQSEHDKNLAMAIEMRENEVYQYQTNINNYSAMLAACIQDSWPQRLLPYRGMGRDQLAQSISDDDDLDLASQLAFRDELKFRIRSEKMECSKSRMMLDIAVASATDIAKIRALIAEIKAARTTV
jgi:hypothetical protein